jgi:hypothetical protein
MTVSWDSPEVMHPLRPAKIARDSHFGYLA